MDYDLNGQVIGVEILNASQRIANIDRITTTVKPGGAIEGKILPNDKPPNEVDRKQENIAIMISSEVGEVGEVGDRWNI